MRSYLLLTSSLIALSPLCAFEERPWFNQPYELRFNGSYNYSYFNKVNSSSEPLNEKFNQNMEQLRIGICPNEVWDIQAEIEIAETTHTSGYFRAGGVIIRRLWLDDIIGDLCSVATSFSVKGVPFRSLQDISTPYGKAFNGELGLSVGKEWCKEKNWIARLWGMFALGFPNQGSPWTRLDIALETNIYDSHYLSLFTQGYFGFGSVNTVNINDFDGWAKYNHSSIDLGIAYEYKLGVWGKIGLAYSRRVLARVYPEGVNSFTLFYHLPFSPF